MSFLGADMVGLIRWIVVGSAVVAMASAESPRTALRAAPPEDDASALAAFENEVRPLLAAKCYRCHGPKKQESGLRLDRRDAALRGGESGPAVVPGKPDESLLIRAVRHEGDLEMPPDDRLEDEQVAALTRWVARGAAWPDDSKGIATRPGEVTPEDRAFWSFRPVVPPPTPAVDDRDWPRTPVDPWILAALEARGLRPAAPAGRRTLIRRATFGLTGLPPTVEEVDAFLADASPDAFARVVDRLLASPAYGERWGRHWLDVVRYADTAGETADYPVREAHRYRDYVIDAFRRDTPYDQFVREQVAGDILARDGPRDAYAERVTATGFLALSRRFGFDSENYQHLTIQDTIDTLGQAVLGLTLGCARCHDHKYDPVTAEDYYALYGIFESTRYPFPGSEQKPNLRVMASLLPPDEAEPLRRAFLEETARVEGELEALKVARPRITLRTLDDLDGDFEVQAKADGGSLGCLVPPWVFEGRPEVTTQRPEPLHESDPPRGHGRREPPRRCGGPRLRPGPPAVPVGEDPRPSVRQPRLPRREGGGRGAGLLPALPGARSRPLRRRRGLDRWRGHPHPRRRGREPIRPLSPGTWYNLQLALDLKSRTYSGTVGVPGT